MFSSLALIVNRATSSRSTIVRWRRAAVNFCLPPTCLLCLARGRSDADGCPIDLCAACERLLPAIDRRAEWPARFPAPWSLVIAPFRYDWPIDRCVQALKFHGELAYGRLLGLLIARTRSRVDRSPPDLVVPVPLHLARHLGRGFNQAAVIGRFAAESLDLPFGAHVLERCRATAEQSHLRGPARAGNVAGAFRLRPGARLAGRRIALVDDVLTTGSTAKEAATVLRTAGAADVELWVAARAARPPRSGAVNVIERDAHEDHHADVVVVEEGAKAGRRLPVADDPLLPQEKHGRRGKARAIPRPEFHAAPREQ
jgi:ComF family protein